MSVVRGFDFVSRLSVFGIDRLIYELTQESAAIKARDWFMTACKQSDGPGVHGSVQFFFLQKKMYLSKLPLPFPLPLALFFSFFIFLGACPPPEKQNMKKQSQWQWKRQ